MSDQLPEPLDSEIVAADPAPASGTAAEGTWFRRLRSVLFIIFCFELGLFLLIYPWTSGWSGNYFGWAAPGRFLAPWHSFWDNSFVRGGLSGLGLVNLWIAMLEVSRMFSRRHANRR